MWSTDITGSHRCGADRICIFGLGLFCACLTILFLPANAASACQPRLSKGAGATLAITEYGEGSRAWRDPKTGQTWDYVAVAAKGKMAGRTYFVTNEYVPSATGGPWSSSRTLPKFVWDGRAVPIKWRSVRSSDFGTELLSIFEGPLAGDWSVKTCPK